MTETGDFLILREHVNSFVRPIFNCTIVGETGQLCPTTEFEFFIFAIRKYNGGERGGGEGRGGGRGGRERRGGEGGRGGRERRGLRLSLIPWVEKFIL